MIYYVTGPASSSWFIDTHPADSFQGNRVNLVHVVDLRGGVVVLTVADDVDQVVVGEVGDNVAEMRERSSEKVRAVF